QAVRGWARERLATVCPVVLCLSRRLCPRAIVLLPVIPEECKLVDIAMEMFLAHRMERPNHAALQECKETLRRIHMHIAARVLFEAVAHRVVATREVLPDAVVARQFIGMNCRTRPHV